MSGDNRDDALPGAREFTASLTDLRAQVSSAQSNEDLPALLAGANEKQIKAIDSSWFNAAWDAVHLKATAKTRNLHVRIWELLFRYHGENPHMLSMIETITYSGSTNRLSRDTLALALAGSAAALLEMRESD